MANGLVPDEDDARYADGIERVGELFLGTECVGVGLECIEEGSAPAFVEGNGATDGVAGSSGVICTKGAPRDGEVTDEASCAGGMISIEDGLLEVEANKTCASSIIAAACGTDALTPIDGGDNGDVKALVVGAEGAANGLAFVGIEVEGWSDGTAYAGELLLCTERIGLELKCIEEGPAFVEGNDARAGVTGESGVRCTKGTLRVVEVVVDEGADGLRCVENGWLEVEAGKTCATSIIAAVCGATELTPIERGGDEGVGALITR